jgi:membrane protein
MKIIEVFKKLINLYDEDIGYWASSLSFFTIFSIIPIFLLFISIITSLPFISTLIDDMMVIIFSLLLPKESETIVEYAEMFLEGSEKLGYMSLVYIIFVSVMFFRDYETIVSKIFGTKARGYIKSLSIYFSLLILAPIAIIVSIYLANWLNLPIFSYIIIWAMFFTIYQVSVSIKLSIKRVLISSFVTSLIWYTIKTLFVYYVIYNKTYTTLYGSFSTVLFIFLWIYLSWFIFLYGLKYCKIWKK